MIPELISKFLRLRCAAHRREISPYIDGELDQTRRARLEFHLDECLECRTELERQSFASRIFSYMSVPDSPDALRNWSPQPRPREARQTPSKLRPAFIALSAAVILAIGGAVAWRYAREPLASWEVVRLAGKPSVGTREVTKSGRLHVGEWIETDGSSRAMIQVGAIGQVELDPNTRVALAEARPDDHRLTLARGRIHATILAPPRLFAVETPSATAIDLGCSYSLEVNDSQETILRVTSGWVSLALNGRESFVPAGAACRTKPGIGPGSPYLEDASVPFQEALAEIDFRGGGAEALKTVLAEARTRDALTLWHLLPRLAMPDRARAYERMASLVPAPAGVTREGVLELDRAMLDSWREAVESASVGADPRLMPTATGSIQPVGSMNAARFAHTATLLKQGGVLITGGREVEGNILADAEIYDPGSGTFAPVGDMTARRVGHTATLLQDGRVLIAGGSDRDFFFGALSSAELFDPRTGTFTPTGDMAAERLAHRATLLRDGRVLITGGQSKDWANHDTAEIYDPSTGLFSSAGRMTERRADHTATLLTDGRVLLTGGAAGRHRPELVSASAEVYDPSSSTFTARGDMSTVRHKHSAELLADGKVIIIGGSDARLWQGKFASAEIYDPITGTFTTTGEMGTARYKIRDAVVLLRDGRVLVAGGGARLEVYDTATGLFGAVKGGPGAARFYATATLLESGDVLIAGGYVTDFMSGNTSAWLYRPD